MLKIPDIIQLNDWKPKKFLRIMIAIHMVMLGAIGLDFVGLEIPILRQVVGFIYLTFVPGIIILRLLKVHKLGVAETVLFSSALSISFLMFSGFFLNSIYYFLKVDSPLSFWKVIIFVTVLVAILCILSCRMDKFYQYELPELNISRTAIYLMLLPILSIVGTYLVDFHNNNIVLMFLIALIALIPIFVALKKIPSELYSLTLVVIAISLLFHRSLLSMYLTGTDIHSEYYFYKLVINNAYWNINISNNVNAMLSIVILPTIYSYFLKIDGTWVFKIVYPIIFSLVPLGLYCVYKQEFKNEKMAFYSVFFFMSLTIFFTGMLSLARQEIAELFFVLLIFLMVQDTLNRNIRNILLLIFGASIVTSHYGLSYIYLILMFFICFFSLGMIETLKIKSLKLSGSNLKKSTMIYFFAFYIVFIILWYINFSSSSGFKSIVFIGDHIFSSISNEFFNPANRDSNLLQGLGVADLIISSFGRQIHRYLQFITQILIIIGFLKIIIYRESVKLKTEFFYLILASFFILLLSLLPFAAKALNMTRIYHITLFALSPLLIVGGEFLIENLIKTFNNKIKSNKNHTALILIFIILVPYFMFNTGFVYEITNDVPNSMSLGKQRMESNNLTKDVFYRTNIQEQDFYSAIWLDNYEGIKKRIYTDGISRDHVLRSYGMTWSNEVYGPTRYQKLISEKNFPITYYIYLSKFNVCGNTFAVSPTSIVNTTLLLPLTNRSIRAYSNGCSEIYTK